MTTTHPDVSLTSVTLHFDPSCPFTWRTSRWLRDVAARRGLAVAFRPFEIAAGAPLADLPEEWRPRVAQGRRFLRAVQRAGADGRDDLVDAAYTAYGQRVHVDGEQPDDAFTEQVWRAAAGEAYIASLDDESLDAEVLASRTAATTLAGDDVGSPVLVVETAEGSRRGFFGPVLDPLPTGDDADRLFDALRLAASVPQFFELKTRRDAPQQAG